MTFSPSEAARLAEELEDGRCRAGLHSAAADQLRAACEEAAFLRGIESRVNGALVNAGCVSALTFDEHIRRLAAERDALRAEVERLRGIDAVERISQMLSLGEPVRPDIHARVVRERDSIRAELEAARARLALVEPAPNCCSQSPLSSGPHDQTCDVTVMAALRAVYDEASRHLRDFERVMPTSGYGLIEAIKAMNAIDAARKTEGK